MFYKKNRPTTFDEIVGNAITIKALKATLASGDPIRQYLITGPIGSGKTTMARIIASIFLNVPATEVLDNIDYHEVSMPNDGGIKMVNSVRFRQNYRPMEGKYFVYCFDECGSLSKETDSAFLKTIEDSRKHVVHIFVCLEEKSLSEPLVSRCAHYRMQALTEDEIVSGLQIVLKNAGKIADPRILREIVRQTDGMPRNAITLLQQIISLPFDDQVEFLVNKKAAKAADTGEAKGLKQKSK